MHLSVPYSYIDLRVYQTIDVSELSYIRTHDRVRTGNEIQKGALPVLLTLEPINRVEL